MIVKAINDTACPIKISIETTGVTNKFSLFAATSANPFQPFVRYAYLACGVARDKHNIPIGT